MVDVFGLEALSLVVRDRPILSHFKSRFILVDPIHFSYLHKARLHQTLVLDVRKQGPHCILGDFIPDRCVPTAAHCVPYLSPLG